MCQDKKINIVMNGVAIGRAAAALKVKGLMFTALSWR